MWGKSFVSVFRGQTLGATLNISVTSKLEFYSRYEIQHEVWSATLGFWLPFNAEGLAVVTGCCELTEEPATEIWLEFSDIHKVLPDKQLQMFFCIDKHTTWHTCRTVLVGGWVFWRSVHGFFWGLDVPCMLTQNASYQQRVWVRNQIAQQETDLLTSSSDNVKIDTNTNKSLPSVGRLKWVITAVVLICLLALLQTSTAGLLPE